MNEKVREKLELFVENRNIINAGTKVGYESMIVAEALVFTNANRKADFERVKECREKIKKKTGALSGFRGMIEPILSGKLSLQADPEKYFDEVLRIYSLINKSKIDSYEAIIAAMNVIDLNRADEADAVIEKCQTIMNRMKKEHRLITNQEDIPFAMLLALTDKDVDSIIREMEECYVYIRNNFKVGQNSAQGISEVLTLYDTDAKTKCDRVIEIYNLLKEQGERYGKDHEFASLGVLTNLKLDTGTLVSEISEASVFLMKNKGFGNWSIGPAQRLMFAAMLVAEVYGEDTQELNSIASTTSISVIIAGEIISLMLIMWSNSMFF